MVWNDHMGVPEEVQQKVGIRKHTLSAVAGGQEYQ
jgi:hypothetical protein